MQMILKKAYLALFAMFYVGWNVMMLKRAHDPADRQFGIWVSTWFFTFYVLMPLLFAGSIKLEQEKIVLERFQKRDLPLTSVRRCWGFYLFPWQLGILLTDDRFPFNLFVFGDDPPAKRRSPFSRGVLAEAIWKKKQPQIN
jgi:hypothetical protein